MVGGGGGGGGGGRHGGRFGGGGLGDRGGQFDVAEPTGHSCREQGPELGPPSAVVMILNYRRSGHASWSALIG